MILLRIFPSDGCDDEFSFSECWWKLENLPSRPRPRRLHLIQCHSIPIVAKVLVLSFSDVMSHIDGSDEK